MPHPRPPRPFGRLDSIVLKVLAVVGVSASAAALITWWGTNLGFNPLYILPAAIGSSLLVAALVSSDISEPLKQATVAAKSMARGDYSVRVIASTHDEVGQLAEAFNTMARDLAQVDRLQRDMVANVSHELRTPVAALRALLENMADGVEEASPANLEAAVRQTERLTELLQFLLDLSRLEAGAAGLSLSEIAVTDLVDDAIETTRLASIELGRDVYFSSHIEPADATFRGDRARLLQVLVNVLDNAARHTPPGTAVQVDVTTSRHSVRIDVSDHGPGVEPADRERVFGRFQRAQQPGEPLTGGTGLGLAIARWAVNIHGGTIAVVDAEVGARFRIQLPLAGPPSPASSGRRKGTAVAES